jgi:hypothetical protein
MILRHNISKIEYPVVVIILLCVADIVTTLVGVHYGAVEINFIVYSLGIPLLIFMGIKLVATLAIMIITVARHRGKKIYGKNVLTRQLSPKWLWLVVGILGLVVINNIVTIIIQLTQ